MIKEQEIETKCVTPEIRMLKPSSLCNMVQLPYTPWLIAAPPWVKYIPKRPGITE